MHTHIHNFLAEIRLSADGVPIYVQIREQILAAIASGSLSPGSQLPTMRQVAVALSVDLNTVRHAYDELERKGAIILVRGRGSFVATLPSPAPIDAEPLDQMARQTIDLAKQAGFDPADLAHRILRLSKGV